MEFNNEWNDTGNLEFVSGAAEPKVWSADGNLDFVTEWDTTGKLEFVVGGGATAAPVIDITAVSYNLPPLALVSVAGVVGIIAESEQSAPIANAGVALLFDVLASCESARPDAEAAFLLDINVDRDPKAELNSAFDRAIPLPVKVSSMFSDSPKLSATNVATMFECDDLANWVVAPHSDLPPLDIKNSTPLVDGVKLQAGIEQLRDRMNDAAQRHSEPYHAALNCNAAPVASSYRHLPRGDCAVANSWALAEQHTAQLATNTGYGLPVALDWLSRFENGIDPTGTRPVMPVVPPVVDPVVIPELDFRALWDNSGALDFLRIELDALIVMNEFHVYNVAADETKTELKPTGTSISLDIDSFAWTFSGTLHGDDSLPYVQQGANGAPLMETYINGHVIRFYVREYKRNRQLAGNSYSFTAVSGTQFLAAPWSEKAMVSNDAPISAFQLAESQVAPAGFTINRNTLTPDWTLAATSYSANQVSPIDVLNEIISACGAIIQPDKLTDIIHVQPRYKVSPWNWAALTDEQCDHVIPVAAISVESGENNQSSELNSVLISGENYGVTTLVTKTGSAGDSPASDIVSQLSQDHNVNAELARNIMADSGDQEVVGLNIPLMEPGSNFGLLLPGEIVRIKYSESHIETGLCLNNSLSINAVADIWQSVKLELNHGYS